MLYCPCLSPLSFSRRFPGGTRKSSRTFATLRISSLRPALRWTSGGSFRENWRLKTFSVSRSAKLLITLRIITQYDNNINRYHSRVLVGWRLGQQANGFELSGRGSHRRLPLPVAHHRRTCVNSPASPVGFSELLACPRGRISKPRIGKSSVLQISMMVSDFMFQCHHPDIYRLGLPFQLYYSRI